MTYVESQNSHKRIQEFTDLTRIMGNSNTHCDVVFLYKSRVCVVTKVSTDFIHVAHDYPNLELK